MSCFPKAMVMTAGALLGGVIVAAPPPEAEAQVQDSEPSPIVFDRTLLDTPEIPAGYAGLLDRYLIRLPRSGEVTETRFDYVRFREEPGQKEIRKHLRALFLAVDPEGLDLKTRYAWALNAYNFLVIDIVTETLVSQTGDTLDSIADVGDGNFAVFDQKRIRVAGDLLSLNEFETRFLFHDIDRDGGKLPEGLDPRLHFALVCAAVGCPPLWPEPYRAAVLDRQLDRAVHNALLNPRHLRVHGKSLHVSPLFEWYARDFEAVGGVREFLRRHAPGEVVKTVLTPGARAPVLPVIPWDWSLNRP